MRAKLKAGIFVLVTLAACGSLAFADVAATIDPSMFSEGFPRVRVNMSIGWRFFVDKEIAITHLGLFDDGDDGLETTHTMGIWRVKKEGGLELLRQVDIGPGAESGGDHYVYVDIVDVMLVPDPVPWIDPDTGIAYYERWLVGVWSPGDNTDGLVIQPQSAATITAQQDGVIRLQNYTYRDSLCFIPPWGYTSLVDHYGVNFKFKTVAPPTPIGIDIKPGSYPNAINLGSNGIVPVAILSNANFNATAVVPDTVFLAGSGVAIRGKGNNYLARKEDVNGDGLMDLVVQVETENLDPGTFQQGYATLDIQETSYPRSIVLYRGSDEITIVPPE